MVRSNSEARDLCKSWRSAYWLKSSISCHGALTHLQLSRRLTVIARALRGSFVMYTSVRRPPKHSFIRTRWGCCSGTSRRPCRCRRCPAAPSSPAPARRTTSTQAHRHTGNRSREKTERLAHDVARRPYSERSHQVATCCWRHAPSAPWRARSRMTSGRPACGDQQSVAPSSHWPSPWPPPAQTPSRRCRYRS